MDVGHPNEKAVYVVLSNAYAVPNVLPLHALTPTSDPTQSSG